jgi:hypothetical protein
MLTVGCVCLQKLCHHVETTHTLHCMLRAQTHDCHMERGACYWTGLNDTHHPLGGTP